MASSYTIKVAPAAVWSLQDAESYKSHYIGIEQAATWSESLFLTSIQAISKDPARYRHNAILSDKGIALRERLSTEDDFRCLYDVDEEHHVIEILLFVSMKQDLEKMLYRYHVLN
ncbi:type II toxin-antitoxin system RelE/ParE family toxin [Pectobacterium jejuense]|uniref:type II toxin-antitoxin system RelE/ParE family toxin n=1 Tax=Pectobacterium jejuense TaxID=2974022 RepID=UPI0032EC309E